NFIPQLKNHLLSRLLGLDFDGDEHEYTAAQRDSVIILGNKIYHHKVLRVNYTTYDIRRNQDSMNSHAHCDIMIHSCESGPGVHPYWYARVIGIFHASVVHADATATNRSLQCIEFLWVRWFGIDPDHRYGSHRAHLPKIGFVPESDPCAFGFLDPSLVIRGCHLIPTFADGRTLELLSCPDSIARTAGEVDDWASYYVNM
ncbi:hypothetical protein POSPLADRAFT_1156730, partial [Postia placenta MAD-698-R-SB12]